MPKTRSAVVAAFAVTLAAGSLIAAAPAQAISGGAAAENGTYAFTAKLAADGLACTGALVAPSWVATAASCFPQNAQGGVPASATTVTVGRTDLTTTAGHVAKVTNLVRQAGRDLMLAKLDAPVTDITPVALDGAAPVTGETLRVAGYGRTATEWVPDKLRTSTFSVSSSAATTVSLTGADGVDTCKGDAGGPVFRETGGRAELVAVTSASWQHGCFGETETRQGTNGARADDLGDWIRQQVLAPAATAVRHAITVSWSPVAPGDVSYRVYGSATADVPVDAAHLLTTTTSTSYTQASLPAKQARYYRVAAAQSVTPVVSATTLSTTADFNGDHKDDVAAAYDYTKGNTALLVWPATQTGLDNFAVRWQSAAGAFNASQAHWVTGDFDGDGRTDIGAFYDYLNASATLFVWHANGTGFDAPVTQWTGAPGTFNAGQARWFTGDFDGDGRTDIAASYDYRNANTSLLVWHATAAGFDAPAEKWNSGVGGFNVGLAQWVTGDFDGDGRDDIVASYDYHQGNTSLLLFRSTGTGFDAPVSKWNSGPGNFNAPQARWVSGDFDGDGRDDVGAFYDYGSGRTGLFTWHATASGFDNNVQKWDSGVGGFNTAQAQFSVGDFDGDGRVDIVATYDYRNANTSLLVWHATAAGFDAPAGKWNSGVGGFNAAQSKLL